MTKQKDVSIEYLETINTEELTNLTISENDTSDTGSNIDHEDYLSDEELSNKYTFLQKPLKKQNNRYKEQFKVFKTKKNQLVEEAYISD